MSKELESLEGMCNIKIVLNKQMRASTELQFTLKNSDDYIIVEKALQRLESIDNAKPSEALECLERLDIAVRYSTIDDEGYSLKEPRKMTNICDEEFNTIKQALLRLDSLDAAMDLLPNRFSCINNREIIVMRTEMYEQYLEQEKVLEIIKEKKLSIFQLSCCKNANEYNDLKFKDNEELTPEEFDLLKRYFK